MEHYISEIRIPRNKEIKKIEYLPTQIKLTLIDMPKPVWKMIEECGVLEDSAKKIANTIGKRYSERFLSTYEVATASPDGSCPVNINNIVETAFGYKGEE